MELVARIQEHGDHVYITCPVDLYAPEQQEIDSFTFGRELTAAAADLRSAAPNPRILWLKGQYVEADNANRNADQWTAGELSIKALTPVLMPVTVMHDLRSAVGTIADARLLTPEEHQVPRARIDTTLAVWEHRFPDIAEECRVNAGQGTMMQSMECLSPYYDCSTCGKMLRRGPKWQSEWKEHIAAHDSTVASDGRSPARILRNVTFTGVGLIFGTRGARGAMPAAHLEVEELAAMHREAHASTARKPKRPRRKNTVEIEDTKYEGMVAAKAEADGKVNELTAQVTTLTQRVEALEAEKVKAEEERDAAKAKAEEAEEAQRVAAMKDERIGALGTGFVAKLDKLETTAKRVREQAATLTDEEWSARLDELEETLSVKRDAKLDEKETKDGEKKDATAGLLFNRETVAKSGLVTTGGETEVTAGEGDTTVPTVERRQSVMGGLIRPRKKESAKA